MTSFWNNLIQYNVQLFIMVPFYVFRKTAYYHVTKNSFKNTSKNFPNT
jgi:hypothetical protein